MDQDESGTISLDELDRYFEDVRMKSYFQVLGIDPDDSERLFRLLDEDGSGEVGIDEFLDGCLRLKGDARSIDVHSIMYQCNAILHGVNALTDSFELPRYAGGTRGDDPAEGPEQQQLEIVKEQSNSAGFFCSRSSSALCAVGAEFFSRYSNQARKSGGLPLKRDPSRKSMAA